MPTGRLGVQHVAADVHRKTQVLNMKPVSMTVPVLVVSRIKIISFVESAPKHGQEVLGTGKLCSLSQQRMKGGLGDIFMDL